MVAIDVGNSAVKIAMLLGDTVVDDAIRIGPRGWEQLAVDWVRKRLDEDNTIWRVASVHQAAAGLLDRAIRESNPDAIIELVSRHEVPMQTNVDHPDRLGIDRLLSAYAAANRFGPPVVVVDAGSAVTVDWIDGQGHFCGGAILPGLGLQSRSLQRETEALPELQWDGELELRLPAQNTNDAIRSGILIGISAAIDELIIRYCDAAGAQIGEIQVALTGGDAATLSRNLQHAHQVVPNLVCRGLLDLPRSLVGRSNSHSKHR
jgi:type III pantothenate kinase